MTDDFKVLIMDSGTFDSRIIHPFTCIVNGPTRSGKSTFVYNLLKEQGNLIDVTFDRIVIFIGTKYGENKLFGKLKVDYPRVVEIVSLPDLFHTRKNLVERFPAYFEKFITERSAKNEKHKYCLVFDDLMRELAECGLLVDLFSKYSSHKAITVIFITQNLNYKGKGGSSTDGITIYRNTHLLVLFYNPLDGTAISSTAQKISPSGFKNLASMLHDIVQKHRYVVIRGSLESPQFLRYSTNIFARGTDWPRVFTLEKSGRTNKVNRVAFSSNTPNDKRKLRSSLASGDDLQQPLSSRAKVKRIRVSSGPPLSRRRWRRHSRAVQPLKKNT